MIASEVPAFGVRRSVPAVGEQTGGLDEMLSKIADFYDEEVDAAVSGLLALMEPIMIVFLGVIVGGMSWRCTLRLLRTAPAYPGPNRSICGLSTVSRQCGQMPWLNCEPV